MKIPPSTSQNNAATISEMEQLNQFCMFQAHLHPPHKPISKRNRARKAPLKSRQKNNRHFKISTSQNSNFKLIESSTRYQIDSQIERDNSCSTIQEQEVITKPALSHLQSQTLISQQIPIEISPHFQDILSNLLKRQSAYVPKMLIPTDQFSEKNRNVLTNWMFQACTQFNFKIQTFFLAVNILDRTLGEKAVKIEHLAGVGLTAIFIASKYEEIITYKLKNLTAIIPATDKVNESQILALENQILMLLNFDLGYPSPVLFIQHMIASFSLSQSTHERALQIARQLICSPYWRYRVPSSIAFESVKIAIKQQNMKEKTGQFKSQNKLRIYQEYLSFRQQKQTTHPLQYL